MAFNPFLANKLIMSVAFDDGAFYRENEMFLSYIPMLKSRLLVGISLHVLCFHTNNLFEVGYSTFPNRLDY